MVTTNSVCYFLLVLSLMFKDLCSWWKDIHKNWRGFISNKCYSLQCISTSNWSHYLDKKVAEYTVLVYTTQVNSTFRARWLASLEVISQVLFTSEQPKKNKMAFVAIFPQIKLLFGSLIIQLVWYILKQLFTSVSVKVVDIYLHFGE